jgi:phage tail-like protein
MMKPFFLSAAVVALGAAAYSAPLVAPNKMEMTLKLAGKVVTVPITEIEGLSPEATSTGRKIMGKVKATRVTIKFAYDKREPLVRWHALARENHLKARREVTIVQYDNKGAAFRRYKLENAWPSKIEIGGLKAGSAQPAEGRMIIDCEGYAYLSGELLGK